MINSVVSIIPPDQLRMIISLHSAIIFSFAFKFFNSRNSRLLFSLALGLLLQFLMYGNSVFTLHLCTTICYLLTKHLPRENAGLYVTIFSLLFLSIVHIYRMITDFGGWSLDISTILMMTVCKYSAYAFSYSDFIRTNDLSVRAKLHSIENINALEYFSYIYFFPACLIGPFFEFKDFIDFMNKEGRYKEIPSTFSPTLKRYFLSILYGSFFYSFKGLADKKKIMNNEGLSDFQAIFSFLAYHLHKYKYVLGFCLSESALISSGISYKVLQDQKESFDGIRSVSIQNLEKADCPKKFFQNWNVSIHIWLKNYVYFRIYPNEKMKLPSYKSRANFITFMVSAFWHGFYPSYYIVFLHFPLGSYIEEKLERLTVNHPSWNIFSFLLFQLSIFVSLSYFCAILDCLDFSEVFVFLYTIKFFFTLYMIAIAVLLYLIDNYRFNNLVNKDSPDQTINQEKLSNMQK